MALLGKTEEGKIEWLDIRFRKEAECAEAILRDRSPEDPYIPVLSMVLDQTDEHHLLLDNEMITLRDASAEIVMGALKAVVRGELEISGVNPEDAGLMLISTQDGPSAAYADLFIDAA